MPRKLFSGRVTTIVLLSLSALVSARGGDAPSPESEVQALRQELADQKKEIEELRLLLLDQKKQIESVKQQSAPEQPRTAGSGLLARSVTA